MSDFATNLKKLRAEKGLSQQKVADSLGIKQKTYSNYENGYAEPSLDVLTKISNFFEVTLDQLVKISLIAASKEDRAFFFELAKRSEIGIAKTMGKSMIHVAENLTNQEHSDKYFSKTASELKKETETKKEQG